MYKAVDPPIKTKNGLIVEVGDDGTAIELVAVPGGDVRRTIEYAPAKTSATPDEFTRVMVSFTPLGGVPEPPGELVGFTDTGLAEIHYPARSVTRHRYVGGWSTPVVIAAPEETVYVRLTEQFTMTQPTGMYEQAKAAAVAMEEGAEVVLFNGQSSKIWLRCQDGEITLNSRRISPSGVEVESGVLAKTSPFRMVMTVLAYREWADKAKGRT